MNLQLFKFKITGLLPLLTHNPAGMSNESAEVKVKKYPSPAEQAETGTYHDEEGNYAIPSVQFRSCLLNGAKGRKYGKRSARDVLQGSVFTSTDSSTLIDPKTEKPLKKYEVDTRRVVIQRNGILRHRPKYPTWGCYLYLQIDEELITAQQVEAVLNIGGQTVGVGDFRIEKRGQFGAFKAELIKD